MPAQKSITITIPKGRYVVAVSGGVDSMVLLDVMRRQGYDLVVAHVNHGIRDDSYLDEALVYQYCMSHNISFVSKKLHLGKDISENDARNARYNFLQQCRINEDAIAVVTAHHQDDMVETAIINMFRGTGWRGIAPFMPQRNIKRPLLDYTKQQLTTYARTHNVAWREDTTNTDQRYLRNYVRQTVVPWLNKSKPRWRVELLRLIRRQRMLRRTIEQEEIEMLTTYVQTEGQVSTTARHLWIMLPHDVAYELLQTVLRQQIGQTLVRALAQELLLFAKVARPGKKILLGTGWQARVTSRDFIVEPRDFMVK